MHPLGLPSGCSASHVSQASSISSNLNLPPDDESDAGHAEEDDDEDRANNHPHGDALAAGSGRVGDGVELGCTGEGIEGYIRNGTL